MSVEFSKFYPTFNHDDWELIEVEKVLNFDHVNEFYFLFIYFNFILFIFFFIRLILFARATLFATTKRTICKQCTFILTMHSKGNRGEGTALIHARSTQDYAARLSSPIIPPFSFHEFNRLRTYWIRRLHEGLSALPPLLLFHFLYFVSSFLRPYLALPRPLEVLDQEFL